MSGDLIRLLNRSKLVERSLFAIIDLLQGTKINLFVLIMACGGMIFIKNFKVKKKVVHFILFHFILFQSLFHVVPTFDTKVTEYFCLGWVFFSSDKFRLFN